MKLTAVEQREAARRACWMLDVRMGRFTGDSAVYPGQGVPDLDQVITLIASGTQAGARFFIESGAQFSVPKPFDIDDLLAIRAYYIGFYGDVAKPDVYTPPEGEAVQL